jgi:hypothetical protein
MPHVLPVATREVRHPLSFVIAVKADDGPPHEAWA